MEVEKNQSTSKASNVDTKFNISCFKSYLIPVDHKVLDLCRIGNL